LSESLSYHRR